MKLFSQTVLTALVAALALTVSASDSAAPLAPGQWTAERARTWHQEQPWLVGCNSLPSTVVNDVEMWQADTFDARTIDRELGWAQERGSNWYVDGGPRPANFATKFQLMWPDLDRCATIGFRYVKDLG
jgi:hypothetical protein